jgi:microcystin-dependent protein
MSDQYVGEIRAVCFNFAPINWAECTGTTMNVQQNAALFALIGTFFGGNGQTTFQLPDLQGRMAMGQGVGAGLSPRNIGNNGGTENSTITLSNLPAHTHTAQNGAANLTAALGGASATGNITIPASNATAGGFAAPNSNRYVGGSTTATLYQGSSNTTLAPFATTLPVTGSVSASIAANAIPITVNPTGTGLPFPNLPPFLVINYIIALQGLFPQRP